MTVEEPDARTMARRLAREEGIFCGTSSGMNVAAAIEIARQLGSGHTVATVTCDTGLGASGGQLLQRLTLARSPDEPRLRPNPLLSAAGILSFLTIPATGSQAISPAGC
ncbi:MAG: hypothetical protein R2849_19670 [Thermomicrobiales bacterium]